MIVYWYFGVTWYSTGIVLTVGGGRLSCPSVFCLSCLLPFLSEGAKSGAGAGAGVGG